MKYWELTTLRKLKLQLIDICKYFFQVVKIQLPDLQYAKVKVDFSAKVFSTVIEICKFFGKFLVAFSLNWTTAQTIFESTTFTEYLPYRSSYNPMGLFRRKFELTLVNFINRPAISPTRPYICKIQQLLLILHILWSQAPKNWVLDPFLADRGVKKLLNTDYVMWTALIPFLFHSKSINYALHELSIF